LLYYNSLFMLAPTFLVAYNMGELDKAWAFEGWSEPFFVLQFLLSCLFGFILVRGTYCTQPL